MASVPRPRHSIHLFNFPDPVYSRGQLSLCMVNLDSRGIELVDGTANPFTPWTRGAYVRESPLRVAPPAPALQAPVLTGAAGGQGTPIGPVAQATDGGAQTAGR